MAAMAAMEEYKHQWLLLEFIVLLMMDVKSVRNM